MSAITSRPDTQQIATGPRSYDTRYFAPQRMSLREPYRQRGSAPVQADQAKSVSHVDEVGCGA